MTPHAKENKVEKQQVLALGGIDAFNGNSYKVYVTAPPEDSKANKKVIELLADYFKVAKSQVKIIKGEVSRNKIVEIVGI
ncbi:DUF167 domain-containing protein [Patescibacteria group bacterium]|nr:DUF167 domain-containing protein [Patescibacteria group bacterium]